MVANGRHHLAWWRAASRAENEQIRSFDRFPITELIVRWIRAGGDEGTIEPTPSQVVLREFGQGFPRMIFVLSDHEYDVRAFVRFEMKRFAAEKVRAGDRRAPIFFDMGEQQISAGKMADVRRHARV